MPSNASSSTRTSLVLPVYNGAETLERALCSVVEQSHALDEIVIVNDGSADATGEIIAAWQKRLPIVAIQNPENKGVTYSLQRGVAQASGDLVFRLDADDVWFPNHVETVLELRQNHPEAVLFATRAVVRTAGPEDDQESRELDDGNVRAFLLWDNPLVHSAVAFDKQAYDAVGGYGGPKYSEDYDLWIRLLSNGRFAGVAGSHNRILRDAELCLTYQPTESSENSLWAAEQGNPRICTLPPFSRSAYFSDRAVAACRELGTFRMKSILIPVYGGLGNQMFQVAHALNLGQKVGATLNFTNLTPVTGRVARKWELDCFAIPQKPVTKSQAAFLKVRISLATRLQRLETAFSLGVLEESVAAGRDVVSMPPKVCSGYWQGVGFFEEAAELVKQTFTFPEIDALPPGLDIDKDRHTVAVHVRRGDYVSDPIAHAYHFVCGADWYLDAMQQMRDQVPGAVFYIFSDDQTWAHEQFGAAEDVSIVATDPKSPAWIDMALMTRCKHFIISNSSYSWWGSYLGKTSESVIFAPKFWFRDVMTRNQTIYCPDWTLR